MIITKQSVIVMMMVLLVVGTVSGNTINADWLVTQIKEPGKSNNYELDREYNVEIPVDITPRRVTWFVVEQ